MTLANRSPCLIAIAGARACAIPLVYVDETMRPLPLEPIAGMPSFVRGLSILRGDPVPVLALAEMLGTREPSREARWIALRLTDERGERRVALAVDSVVGVHDLDTARVSAMPPLLGDANADVVAAITTLDAQLLLVLHATHLMTGEVTDELWRAVDAHSVRAT